MGWGLGGRGWFKWEGVAKGEGEEGIAVVWAKGGWDAEERGQRQEGEEEGKAEMEKRELFIRGERERGGRGREYRKSGGVKDEKRRGERGRVKEGESWQV